ncbi:MAG: hypothetical protein LBR16_07475 [Treponema sp.]|jgi:hypothetical protein|nr:hypothetical protein [Treponema sp.]
MTLYEKLLYQPNAAPSRLAMLSLVFNTAQIIFSLNSIDVNAGGIRVAEIILLNIVLSFAVFVAATEVKRYSVPWSWGIFGIAVFQALRIAMMPASISGVAWAGISGLFAASAASLFAASLWSLAQCRRYRIAQNARKEASCHS